MLPQLASCCQRHEQILPTVAVPSSGSRIDLRYCGCTVAVGIAVWQSKAPRKKHQSKRPPVAVRDGILLQSGEADFTRLGEGAFGASEQSRTGWKT